MGRRSLNLYLKAGITRFLPVPAIKDYNFTQKERLFKYKASRDKNLDPVENHIMVFCPKSKYYI